MRTTFPFGEPDGGSFGSGEGKVRGLASDFRGLRGGEEGKCQEGYRCEEQPDSTGQSGARLILQKFFLLHGYSFGKVGASALTLRLECRCFRRFVSWSDFGWISNRIVEDL